MAEKNYELVYSTDPEKQNKKSLGHGKAVMRLEKRVGKNVTVIERLCISDDELKKLCKDIKSKCGTGGTVKDHHIEIQGDFRDKIRPLLKSCGYNIAG